MPDFLDGYGVSDARRERLIKRLIVSLLIVTALGITGYFLFRNWREERQAKKFFEHLEQKDYQAAYRLWGCEPPAKPCRDYSMERFLEDWGPKSLHADLSKMKVLKTKSCSSGIIQIIEFGPEEEVLLWVDRQDLTLSFAPWPVCQPRWQAP